MSSRLHASRALAALSIACCVLSIATGATRRRGRLRTSRGRRSSLRPDLDLLSERSQAHGADEGLKEELELRRKCKKDCEEALTELRDENPGVTRAVETRYVANLVLRRQREIVDELLHHGELTTLDAVALKAQLNQHIKQLYFQESWTLQELDDREALLQVPAFRFLQQDLLAGGELEILPGADAPAGEPSGGQTARTDKSSGSIGTSRSPGKSPTTPSGGWFGAVSDH